MSFKKLFCFSFIRNWVNSFTKILNRKYYCLCSEEFCPNYVSFWALNFGTYGQKLMHYHFKSVLLSEVLRFLLYVLLFCCRVTSRIHNHHVSLDSYGYLSNFPYIFMTLIIFKGPVRYFIECLSIGVCLMILSWQEWAYMFWEGRNINNHLHHIMPWWHTVAYIQYDL
jgi:hypothetical protein